MVDSGTFSPSVRRAASDETGGSCGLLCENVLPAQRLPGSQPATTTRDAAHIIDRKDGGAKHIWNALWLCQECNGKRERRTSLQFPYGLAEPEKIGLAWYASGYSVVAAKVMLYTTIDASNDKRESVAQRTQTCIGRLLRCAYYFVDFNFLAAAQTAIALAHKLAGGKALGLGLDRQMFSMAIDAGEYQLARSIAVDTGLLERDDDREHVESILWREALLIEAEGDPWRALGMLRDMSTYPEPDVRARFAIVEANIEQRREKDNSRLGHLVEAIQAFNAGFHVPRPQTLQRIQALLDVRSRSSSMRLSEEVTEKLKIAATAFPIRCFVEVSEHGYRDLTATLQMNPAYARVHASAKAELEGLANQELGDIERSLRQSLA
jgi:hypothetical protein